MFTLIAASLIQMVTSDPKVIAVPFGAESTANTALADAVDNALPKAAKERGLFAVRNDNVKPVHEAMLACREDGCRTAAARRLGARYAVLGAVDHGALLLRIVDVEVGDAVGSVRVDGEPPAVLAGVPDAVDDLVEQVSPKATRARNAAIVRARRARDAGDLDAADGAYASAVDASKGADAVNIWLERCRLFDAADRGRESKTWDAFAAALGPGTPGNGGLDEDDRVRVRTAIRENLAARAAYDEDAAADGDDRQQRMAAAAKARLKIAALFPQESAVQSLLAAKLLVAAGDDEGARAIFQRLAKDGDADEDARLEALAKLHAR